MKRMKKGFTIVELVIVIAVIGILAAILIPTFAGAIKTAQLNADKQTVRQLNTALATKSDVDTYNKMADILIEQGYKGNENLIPVSKGYTYYWVKDTNTIVLVNEGKVVFPEDARYENLDLTAEGVYEFKACYYIVTSTATTSDAAVADIKAAVGNGNSFKLVEKIEEGITVPTISITKSVDVDLAGSKINAEIRTGRVETAQSDYAFSVTGGATLTVSNAEIEARGIEVKGGTVVLEENVNIVCDGTNGGSALWVEGADSSAIINGGTYTAKNAPENGVSELEHASTAITIKGGATCVINGGTFVNEKTIVYTINVSSSTVTINDATIKGIAGVAAEGNSNVTLNNCTIEIDSATVGASSRHVLYASGNSTITLNGGNITAKLGVSCSVERTTNNGTITKTGEPTINVLP